MINNISENDVQKSILHFVNLQHDFFAWRNNSIGVYDQTSGRFRRKAGFDISGVSDILSVFSPQGRIVALEVKNPLVRDKGLSLSQEAFLKKINKMGGVALCVWSLEQVQDLVKDLRDGLGR